MLDQSEEISIQSAELYVERTGTRPDGGCMSEGNSRARLHKKEKPSQERSMYGSTVHFEGNQESLSLRDNMYGDAVGYHEQS